MTGKEVWRMLKAPTTLVILLALLLIGAWWGYSKILTIGQPQPPAPCVTQTMTELVPAEVEVRVMNGGDRRGLATQVYRALAKVGFDATVNGNIEETIAGTVIVGNAVDNPEVLLVAGWFTNPEIRADERPDHTVDVLVGNDYDNSAIIAEGPASLPLESGTVCLPADETPSAAPSVSASAPN